jgi:cytochrome c551/c552
MPAWGQAKGGPLTNQQIEEVVAFLQLGDWNQVQTLALPPKMVGQPPTASSLSAAEQEKGLALFKAKGCVGCHTLGNMGGTVGPDLTHVGSWRDADYLENWIKAPAKFDRSNFIWSSGQKVPMDKAVMPTMPTTASELKTLVNYLSSLK